MHPRLKPILRNSNGAVLYRNQVVEIAKVIACYTEEEANELRVSLESCQPGGISSQRHRFIAGAVKNWVDQQTAERIFKQIAYFSRYDFRDEWQAADHTLLAYRSAYLKFHYPEEYLVALDNSIGAKVQLGWEADDAISELQPLVNRFMQARLTADDFPGKVSSLQHQVYADLFGTT
jgi:DNA polymerase III alpha subunit